MTVGGSQINGKLKSIEDGSNPFQEIVPSHGRFEDIPGTCLKAMTYDDYETTNSTDKWTQEFGEVKDIKAYHSIHYKNERPFIDPLVPRRFFLNGTLYIEAKERKMAWDEPLFEVIYLIVIEEIAQMMQTETLDSALVENFCLVIIPIWITWFNIERLNNLFGAENTTFKFFSWIYYVCVVTMAVNALNVFAEDPEQCTIIPYLGAYFLSQGLCLFYSLSLYYTVPKLAGPRLWVSSLNIICGLPAIMPLFYPIPVKAAWWTAWTLQFLSFKIIVVLKHYFFSSPNGFIMNVDYHIQATSGFSLGVISQLIVNIMWDSKNRHFSGADIGTLCGLFIAMALQYFYFIGDGPNIQHALKKSFLAGLAWQTLHLPFYIAILVSGAAMSVNTNFAANMRLHETNVITPWATVRRVQTIFTASTALVILLLALLSSLHGRQNVTPRFLAYKYILGSRIVVGLSILAFGFGAQDWTGIELFVVVWFLWFMLTVFNIVGMQPLKRSWDRGACH